MSIKVDIATRLDRSVMGVNVQFCNEGKIVLRNLCVKELKSRHTGEHIKKELIDVLAEFKISPSQIYSITTDNAANMVRAVQLLGEEADIHLELDSDEEEPEDNTQNQEHLSQVEEEWASTLEALPNDLQWEGVLGLRCAAHTLQLAVADVLKEPGITAILNSSRSLCRKLRTPNISYILDRLGQTKPILDCPTRWHSTLDMVESLLEVRDVYKDVIPRGPPGSSSSILSDSEWSCLQDIARTLKPAKLATKRLQEEQLLVGDFLEAWLRCKIDTKSINSSLAQSLYTAMEQREEKLFNSPAILCGIFMDPRWQLLLSNEQKLVAEEHLLLVWQRLESLRSESTMVTMDDISNPLPQSHDNFSLTEVIIITIYRVDKKRGTFLFFIPNFKLRNTYYHN